MRPLRFQLFFPTAASLEPGVLLRIPIKFSQVSIYLAHDFIDNILFDPVFPGQGKRGCCSPLSLRPDDHALLSREPSDLSLNVFLEFRFGLAAAAPVWLPHLSTG